MSSDIELRKVAASLLTLANCIKSNTSAMTAQTRALNEQNHLMRAQIDLLKKAQAELIFNGGGDAEEGKASASSFEAGGFLSRGEARRAGGFSEGSSSQGGAEAT